MFNGGLDVNAIIKDLMKNNRELTILEIVKEFDMKYSQAAVIVDAHNMLDGLAEADNSIEAWETLVDTVYTSIKAFFNMTGEKLNEIYEFTEWVELEMKADED